MSRRSRDEDVPEFGVAQVVFLAFLTLVILSVFTSAATAAHAPWIQSFAQALVFVTVPAAYFIVWRWWDRRKRFRASCLADLTALDPYEFEQAVADLLRDLGYRKASRVGGAGDLAADIVAADEEGRSAIVQCKRYTTGKKVGSPEVQQFIGMMNVHHGVDRGVYVTTSEFTEPARRLARKHRIELIDGDRLTYLIATLRSSDRPRSMGQVLEALESPFRVRRRRRR